MSAPAATFTTQRLERMAGYLRLEQLDTLPEGTTQHYAYRYHPLNIRKNRWGEIEHIGLLLFPQELRRVTPSPLYDFLERYLLARNATPATSEDAVKMGWDKVHFTTGSAATALKLDTSVVFSEERIDLHVYRVSFYVKDKLMLEMSFDMDYQLLTGCDAVELEHNFIRNLGRYQAIADYPQPAVSLPADGTEYTLTGSYFMSPMVRNDIYYTRSSARQPWQLVSDAARPTKTLSNMMLAPGGNNQIPLVLTLDKYGYLTDSVTTDYRALQQFCMDEGCQPFYGLKGKKDDVYQSAVFMVNRKGGYLHLLSIDVPDSVVKGNRNVRGRVRFYAYIPLYNVNDKMLGVQEFEPVK